MPRKLSTRQASDRKKLRKRLRELELLTKSSRALNSTLSLDQLLDVIIKIVRDAVSAETVSLLRYDAAKENLVFELARGRKGREVLGFKIPIGQGVAGWVAKHKRALIVNDLQNDPRFFVDVERKLGLKTQSIMSIPLKRRNRMIGVIEAVNCRKPERFTSDDLAIFVALGDHIATAIDNVRLYRQAERSRLENSQLYETSVALGKALTLDEVLEQILRSLKKLIPYDVAAIFVLEGTNQELVSYLQHGYRPSAEKKLRLKLDEGIVGWAARHRQGVIVADTSKDKRYVKANARTRSEMVAPMLSRGRVIGLFNLESHRLDAYRTRDLVLLETFAAQAGVSIERARLYEQEQVKQEIERELKVARTVQQFFTPTTSHKVGKYTITGRSYPSLELSGDYLDVFPLREPHVAFAIADVAGKGVPASIIMSSFRATLHTVAPHYTSARNIAVRANQILLETVRPEDFVTAFIGVLNYNTGRVTYCSAGHEPAILMQPNGKYELLRAGGAVLGVFDSNELEEGSFELGDGLLFAYTDGITDATNAQDKQFGLKRLVKFVRANRSQSSFRLCTELRKNLKQFTQNAPQTDDLTFMALKK